MTGAEPAVVLGDFEAAPTAGTMYWDRRIERVIAHIEAHCARGVRLPDLAGVANLHPSHLIREFKKRVGCSPIEYVDKLRIARAASLLMESDQSIKEIGLSVGYRRPEGFSVAFKRATGCSPRSYRQGLCHREACKGAKSQSRTANSHFAQVFSVAAQAVPL